MKSLNPDCLDMAVSAAGLEHWFGTMRADGGFGGSSAGPRGVSLPYCGAAFDWRYEGLLDGHAAMHRATGRSVYLDRIEQDLRDICSAQLLNGTFRNSCFDLNPYEGGMPYEPAMLAAACRARAVLMQNGRSVPAELDQTLERFVETHLLNELWNRLLHTFNDWFQSSFEFYTPHAVAAVIELLIDYAELRNDWPRLERYIAGAADSLLAVQVCDGPLSGGMPLSNRRGSAFSPSSAARCLPALEKTAQKTGQEKYRTAAAALADFVRRHALPGGGFTFLLFSGRPAMRFPVITGAAADVINSFDRAGLLTETDVTPVKELLIRSRMENGAFRTAFGFGDPSGRHSVPDWRDILPCCGWADKVYCFLARRHPGQLETFSPSDVRRAVRIPCGRGEYVETGESMRIVNRSGKTLYSWKKGTKWADICLL